MLSLPYLPKFNKHVNINSMGCMQNLLAYINFLCKVSGETALLLPHDFRIISGQELPWALMLF